MSEEVQELKMVKLQILGAISQECGSEGLKKAEEYRDQVISSYNSVGENDQDTPEKTLGKYLGLLEVQIELADKF